MSTLFPPLRSVETVMLVRDFAFPVLLMVACAFIPPVWTLYAFTLFGFGHLYLAFAYQYKAGKVSVRYLLVAAGLILLGVAYYAFVSWLLPLYIVVITMFGLHFAVDEFYLHRESLTVTRAVTAFAFLMLFAGTAFIPLYPAFIIVAPIAGILSATAAGVRLIITGEGLSRTEIYLWSLGALFCCFFFGAAFYTVFALLNILHYFNWYIAMGIKLHKTSQESPYWWQVARVTGLTMILAASYRFGGVLNLKYLFDPLYFSGLSLLHFILSSRFVAGTKRPMPLLSSVRITAP